MHIIIGSDHAGFNCKEFVKSALEKQKHTFKDVGCKSEIRCDYPDIAKNVCNEINGYTRGILICGTGIGMSICANRHSHIRCALCYDKHTTEMARKHNNANVLAIGARNTDQCVILEIIETFLNTPFEGGRHLDRINKI